MRSRGITGRNRNVTITCSDRYIMPGRGLVPPTAAQHPAQPAGKTFPQPVKRPSSSANEDEGSSLGYAPDGLGRLSSRFPPRFRELGSAADPHRCLAADVDRQLPSLHYPDLSRHTCPSPARPAQRPTVVPIGPGPGDRGVRRRAKCSELANLRQSINSIAATRSRSYSAFGSRTVGSADRLAVTLDDGHVL